MLLRKIAWRSFQVPLDVCFGISGFSHSQPGISKLERFRLLHQVYPLITLELKGVLILCDQVPSNKI
jgi:hypothetical protein